MTTSSIIKGVHHLNYQKGGDVQKKSEAVGRRNGTKNRELEFDHFNITRTEGVVSSRNHEKRREESCRSSKR